MAQIFSKNSTYCASILSFDYILLLQISGFECIFTSEQNGITNEAIFLESYTAQCKMLLLHAKNVREQSSKVNIRLPDITNSHWSDSCVATKKLARWVSGSCIAIPRSFQSPKTMSATLSESSPRVQSCSSVTNPVHQTEMAQILARTVLIVLLSWVLIIFCCYK